MKDILTSPRIIKIRYNRRVRRVRLFVLVSILFISIVGALAFFSGNKKIVIDKIVITGNHIIDKEEIEKEIYKNISNRYFYLFSKSNSFIYPSKKIYNNLRLNFPRIENLSIYRDNMKTLHIDISERTGSYLYCGANLPENKNEVGENCYFVNNDGLIFDTAPYFSGNVYFKFYLPFESNGDISLGRQMIGMNDFHNLARFIDKVTALGFKPIYIIKNKEGTNFLYLDHSLNDTIPKIIFKDDADLDVIYDNLSLSMKKKEFVSEINSKYSTLLYIDLRFKNKVLYKFQ